MLGTAAHVGPSTSSLLECPRWLLAQSITMLPRNRRLELAIANAGWLDAWFGLNTPGIDPVAWAQTAGGAQASFAVTYVPLSPAAQAAAPYVQPPATLAGSLRQTLLNGSFVSPYLSDQAYAFDFAANGGAVVASVGAVASTCVANCPQPAGLASPPPPPVTAGGQPTAVPSGQPAGTARPSASPTMQPAAAPTARSPPPPPPAGTAAPTAKSPPQGGAPTATVPTATPTAAPTVTPTANSANTPTPAPTSAPGGAPTAPTAAVDSASSSLPPPPASQQPAPTTAPTSAYPTPWVLQPTYAQDTGIATAVLAPQLVFSLAFDKLGVSGSGAAVTVQDGAGDAPLDMRMFDLWYGIPGSFSLSDP